MNKKLISIATIGFLALTLAFVTYAVQGTPPAPLFFASLF